MPIVDVELVYTSEAEPSSVSASAVADAIGVALGSARGTVWVRLRFLSDKCYAENQCLLSSAELPVFVTVLQARLPAEPDLALQLSALTQAVAAVVARPVERVHVQFAPEAAGRQAFGGRIVRASS